MSKIVIDMAAMIGPMKRPKIPNLMIPASVERTVIRVWLSGLWCFIELESLMIITGLKKLSMIVPAIMAPKIIIIIALVGSPIAKR
jgi:hypothetical protein